MPYVDLTYYTDEYKGITVDATEFEQLEIRSSEIIDQVTGYKVAQKGIESLVSFQLTQFKKAVCAQIEHFVINGGYESTKEGNTLGNVSIGSFSYGSSSSSDGKSSDYSSSAIDHLKPTGLLYSGVGTRG